MTLTIARFDLDDTPREPNTPRPTPIWSMLPVGFPFLVDVDTGEVVEPVLEFVMHKCLGPRAFSKRRWTKRNTADAYTADLKDWWAKVAQSPLKWHQADDELVEDYLLDLSALLSSHTGDFLAGSTIARRRSTVNEFHKFARRRFGYNQLPVASLRSLRNTTHDADGEETFDSFERARFDANPRPIDDNDVPRLLEALGPRPDEREEWVQNAPRRASGRAPYPSSRTRLATEIALVAGLRIDEIVHLRSSLIEGFVTDGRDDDDNVEFELEISKGLVRRTVYFPVWLIILLKQYIADERAAAIKVARRGWLKPRQKPHPNLFLNSPAAGRHAGKRTTTKQLEADFHSKVMALGLTLPSTKAEGTNHETEVFVAAHSFHDCRHTFAYTLYRGGMGEFDTASDAVLERRFEDVVQNIRLRLGHQQVTTTINVYLRVFNREGEKALRRMSQWVRGIIERNRKKHG